MIDKTIVICKTNVFADAAPFNRNVATGMMMMMMMWMRMRMVYAGLMNFERD